MESESDKCLKSDGIDLISNMPDAILCKILSHMPTKYAMSTKILSTRWKNLSPFEVPPIKVDLDDDILLYPSTENNPCSFKNFVDKLLLETLRDGPSVESVYLHWSGVCFPYFVSDVEKIGEKIDEMIVAWVIAALRLNVVHLSLLIPTMDDSNVLLHTLNGCVTLVELKLKSSLETSVEDLHLCIPGEFILPNLKSLFLESIFFSDASINALIGGCPVLYELIFSQSRFSDNLYIKSPLLKLFVIQDCLFDAEVLFDAPNIEVLVYDCWNDIPNWVGADFKSLHSAYIGINTNCDDDSLLNLAKIVKACSSATRLSLSVESIRVLHPVSVQLSAFGNINWLALGGMDNNVFEVLACFLNSSPTIQTLSFDRSRRKTSGVYERFESLLPTLPDCLNLCLKKIEFLDFEWEEDVMKLVEYFLKNGRVLQEVTLHYRHCKDTSIFNRLLTFSKHSKTCQILIKKYKDPNYDRNLLRRCLSFSNFYTKVSSILG